MPMFVWGCVCACARCMCVWAQKPKKVVLKPLTSAARSSFEFVFLKIINACGLKQQSVILVEQG